MSKYLPTPETLRKLLRYEPETGLLFWRERSAEWFKDGSQTSLHNSAAWNGRYSNKEAFTSNHSSGYKHGQIFKKQHKAHRIAWALYYGVWPSNNIDHINGVRDDNRIENLRDVSMSQNSRNSAMSSNNTSGVCGVHLDKRCNKWVARIALGKNRKRLGSFENIQDAAAARKTAEIEHGFTERHGKPSITPETPPRRT